MLKKEWIVAKKKRNGTIVFLAKKPEEKILEPTEMVKNKVAVEDWSKQKQKFCLVIYIYTILKGEDHHLAGPRRHEKSANRKTQTCHVSSA